MCDFHNKLEEIQRTMPDCVPDQLRPGRLMSAYLELCDQKKTPIGFRSILGTTGVLNAERFLRGLGRHADRNSLGFYEAAKRLGY